MRTTAPNENDATAYARNIVHRFATQDGFFDMHATPESNKGGWDRFQHLLDDQMDWPSEFVFKFIAPQAGLNDLKAVFGRHPVRVRSSRAGNYVSITARMQMHSSSEIIAVYKAAATVEGVILL